MTTGRYVRTGGDVILRAIQDEEFYRLLFRDPDRALAGYHLTRQEALALRELDQATFDRTLSELDTELVRLLQRGSGELPGTAWADLDCRAVNEFPRPEDY